VGAQIYWPLHQDILSLIKSFVLTNFIQEVPEVVQEAIHVLEQIKDWYVDEKLTYIRVYRSTKATLPMHVPN
jgi:hypothetical protein